MAIYNKQNYYDNYTMVMTDIIGYITEPLRLNIKKERPQPP